MSKAKLAKLKFLGFSSCTKCEHTLTNPMFLGTTGSGTLFLVDCEYGARPGMVA